jgi:DNA invertase Pin-like site-specific DNA recombinase
MAYFDFVSLRHELGHGNRYRTAHAGWVGSAAQWEREIMNERHLEGIAKAKTEGKFKSCRAPENVGKKVTRKPSALARSLRRSA